MPTRIAGKLAQSQISLTCVARMHNHTSNQLCTLASRLKIVVSTLRWIQDVVAERRIAIAVPCYHA
jgi:hypothetical protein